MATAFIKRIKNKIKKEDLFIFNIGDLHVECYRTYDDIFFRCADEADAGLAGVRLTLTDIATNEAFVSTPSTTGGSILFEDLPFGEYAVTVTAKPEGYDNPTQLPNIVIDYKGTARIDYVFPTAT